MPAKFIFLGTGPAGGTRSRLESSALLYPAGILIDVTRFFERQSRRIKNIETVLITHAHMDAVGGLAKLNQWLIKKNKKITLYSHQRTISHIKKKFKNTSQIYFKSIKPFKKLKINDVEVTSLPVRHSIQKGFPTYGYFFPTLSLAYVSDTSGWEKKTEKYLKQAKTLIIDGAMWNKKMVAHLTMKEILPKICAWPNKRIIFTQIGKNAPNQKILEKEIKKICPKARPAYDGLEVVIR